MIPSLLKPLLAASLALVASPLLFAQAPVDFSGDLMPFIDQAGCSTAACHGAETGRGGLRLSLFGAYPDEDHERFVRDFGGRRVNFVEPAKSLLLQKVSGQMPHGGAAPFPPSSPAYKKLLAWIQGGAPFDLRPEHRLAAIQASPSAKNLTNGEALKLIVVARFADQGTAEVSGFARFSSSDPRIAGVDAKGVVRAFAPGEAIITAAYRREFAVVRVTIPRPLTAPWPEYRGSNEIDKLVRKNLRRLGIPPVGPAPDAVFLRRAFLALTGVLPGPEEARAFLESRAPDKRAKLVDELLSRDAFADFWTLKWADLLRIKAEFPSNLWPNAVQAYHRWVKDSIKTNLPYDAFAKALLTANGSDFRDPPANYFRAFLSRDPGRIVESTSLLFMGVRLECARCHAHPSAPIQFRDLLGMGAAFSQVAYKRTGEWKEEIVYTDFKRQYRHPRDAALVPPVMLDGTRLQAAADTDLRLAFSEWLCTPKNPYFTRNIANRVWAWVMGRGIIHPVDDLRPTNPPENEDLLRALEEDLVRHHYDLRHLFRTIALSEAFQADSRSPEGNPIDARHFSRFTTRRLDAEVLIDAVNLITGTSESYQSQIPEPFTFLPEGQRAVDIADGSIDSPFLQMFGRPARDTSYEMERNSEISLRQILHFLNSDHINRKMAGPRIARLAKGDKAPEALVDEVYLTVLSRFPDAAERGLALHYLGEGGAIDKGFVKKAEPVQDLVWALLNTKEFLFLH